MTRRAPDPSPPPDTLRFGGSHGPRVVALGDSIGVGVGDTAGDDALHGVGWAAHLAQLAEASTFTNLTCHGARARDVVAEQLPLALDLRPDVATLVVGGNDVLRSDFSAHEVARELSTAVTALRDCGCSVVLGRLPVIEVFELLPATVRRVMRERVTAVNMAVDAVALAAQPRTMEQVTAVRRTADGRRPPRGTVVVVDTDRAARELGPAGWHADRVHLSATAHRRVAAHAVLALAQARVLRVRDVDGANALAAAQTATPPPPSFGARTAWLVVTGIPWCVRRGRDFVPGLMRAVYDDRRERRQASRWMATLRASHLGASEKTS